MKKTPKKRKSMFKGKLKLTVDERLEKIDIYKIAPKKVAEANERLRNMKLPK